MIIKLGIYFYLTSFLGWILESLFKTVQNKKISNSGFLYGPFVPIYGFGSLIIYFSSLILKDNSMVFQVLMYSFLAVSLEYFVSYFFEKMFNMKLWDYKDEKFNLNGRICLKFSLIWAVLIILMVEFGQKTLFILISYIPINFMPYLFTILSFYFVIDIFLSFRLFLSFKNILFFLKNLDINDLMNNLNYLNREKINLDIKHFLQPIKKFENLGRILRTVLKVNNRTIYLFLNKIVTNLVSKETGEDFMDFNYLNNKEFLSFIAEIIENEEYKKLQNYKHHESSIYDHNIKVAYLSFKIGKFLNLKIKDLVRGALFHDFFYYNWRNEKPQSGKLHAFEHPKESLVNAKRVFENITKTEEDIILKHMWPLTLVPPKYIESFIVSVVDKIVATKEFMPKKSLNKSENELNDKIKYKNKKQLKC